MLTKDQNIPENAENVKNIPEFYVEKYWNFLKSTVTVETAF